VSHLRWGQTLASLAQALLLPVLVPEKAWDIDFGSIIYSREAISCANGGEGTFKHRNAEPSMMTAEGLSLFQVTAAAELLEWPCRETRVALFARTRACRPTYRFS
jgi:hypothetical protein